MLGKLAPLNQSPAGAAALTTAQQRLLHESQDGIVRALSRSYQEAQAAFAVVKLSQSQHPSPPDAPGVHGGSDTAHVIATGNSMSQSQGVPGGARRNNPYSGGGSDPLSASAEPMAPAATMAPLTQSTAAHHFTGGHPTHGDRFDDIQSDDDADSAAVATSPLYHRIAPVVATAAVNATPAHRQAKSGDTMVHSRTFSPGTSFNPALQNNNKRPDVGIVGQVPDESPGSAPMSVTAMAGSAGTHHPTGGTAKPPFAGHRTWEQLPVGAHELEAALNVTMATCGDVPVDVPCPAGFVFTVYNGDISQHFNLHSETVQITRGSIKYVDHHARYGPQTRFRFQLCHNYLQRKCAKLSECSYIHATVLPKPSEVHLNPFAPRRLAADRHGRSGDVMPSHFDDPGIADAYPTLAPGFIMTVHPPQGNQTSNELTLVPSEMIIHTVGGEAAYQAYADHGGDPNEIPPEQLPRHCTKFQYRRACTCGSQCAFIHSKIPFPGTWIGITPATSVPTSAAQPASRLPSSSALPGFASAVPAAAPPAIANTYSSTAFLSVAAPSHQTPSSTLSGNTSGQPFYYTAPPQQQPQQMLQPAQHLLQPTQHMLQPTQHMLQPTQHMLQPAQHMLQPAQHMLQPTQHMLQPAQQMLQPTQQMLQPTQQMLQPVPAVWNSHTGNAGPQVMMPTAVPSTYVTFQPPPPAHQNVAGAQPFFVFY